MIIQHSFGEVTLYSVALDDVGGTLSRRDVEQHAVQRLVAAAFGPAAHLAHCPDGAPFITDMPDTYISVSHSRKMAALAVAAQPVGVDIEEPRPALLRVAARFLSPAQQRYYSGMDDLLKAWTLKEAAYKALRPAVPATLMLLPPEDVNYRIVFSGPFPAVYDLRLAIVVSR